MTLANICLAKKTNILQLNLNFKELYMFIFYCHWGVGRLQYTFVTALYISIFQFFAVLIYMFFLQQFFSNILMYQMNKHMHLL